MSRSSVLLLLFPVLLAQPKDAGAQADQGDASKIGFELTRPVMESFSRGVKIELAMHDAYVKRLAALKTEEEYQKCSNSALSTPEGRKILQEQQNRMLKATTSEEILKTYEWAAKENEPLVLKLCGEDPRRVRSQQVEVLRKAEMAGAIEFAKAFDQPHPPGNDDQVGGPAGSQDEWEGWWTPDRIQVRGPNKYTVFCDLSDSEQLKLVESGGSFKVAVLDMAMFEWTSGEAQSYRATCKKDRHRYNLMKEWTAAFCNLPKSTQDEMARKGGIIGTRDYGAGLSYTVDQAKELSWGCNNPVHRLAEAIGRLMSGDLLR
jgi:hypothetical protein